MEADAYAQLSVEDVKAAVERGELTAADAVRLEGEVGKDRKGVLSLADSTARTDEPTGDIRDTRAGLRRLSQHRP